MKILNALYETPCIEVMAMQVEQCVLAGSYGEPGNPGQDSGFIDPDFGL